jgi:poly(A) polymerase
MTDQIAVRWRLSNNDGERLAALAEPVERLVESMDAKAQRRALYRRGAALFADLVLLAWAEWRLAGARAERRQTGVSNGAPWRAMLDEAARWVPRELPIKGADALALGVPHGPEVGQLLAEVEQWWIDEDFKPDRKQALEKLAALSRRR